MKRLFVATLFVFLFTTPAFTLQGPAVEAEVLARTASSWDGSPLPPYPAGQPEVTLLRITVPPGIRLPLHEHPVINAGVLLRGKLTVVTEQEETLHLGAGDAIVEVVGKWHYGINEGEEPAEIIVFYAGVRGEPITVKETAAR